MDSNPIITLQPDSLYIATNQIFTQSGKFHWSLYLTDSSGHATKHHWVQVYGSQYAEAYRVEVVPIRTYSSDAVATFAYLKVLGFTPPEKHIFDEAVTMAFPKPYRMGLGTVKDNRQANLTCRTWLFGVLRELANRGCLERSETLEALEQKVTEISTKLENESVNTGGFEMFLVDEI
ncbi:hypothetical protein H0H92_004044 [Tricholoma furcatifolium]|nr:hypothetical protein H0H92_004044 [Tricholoma furcatifolium]